MIRVLIADDHIMVREGLRRLINACDDLTVVGEASDGVEAVERVRELHPDVVLLDISMPNKDGLEAAAEIASLGLETNILVVTMYFDEEYALRTLRAGASGFLWKGAPFTELHEAIRTVHRGERYLPKGIQAALPGDKLEAAERDRTGTLSKREFQVLCYLAAGMTNREIAKELGISVKTIDTHRGHLLKKLALRNNSDITRYAIRHGFVEA